MSLLPNPTAMQVGAAAVAAADLGATRVWDAGGGGFTPADLAGLTLWVRASSLALANGAAVLAWPDESGLGNDLVGVPGERPAFRSAAFLGGPAVRFVDVHRLIAPSVDVYDGSGSTFVCVYQLRAPNPYGMLMVSASPGGHELRHDGGNLRNQVVLNGGATVLTGFDDTYELNAPRAVAMRYDRLAGLVRLFTGATQQVGGSAVYNGALAPAVSTFHVGGRSDNYYANVDIAELMVWNRSLTDDEYDQVVGYIGATYGL